MELSLKEKLILLAIADKGWLRGSASQVNMNLAAVFLNTLIESGHLRISDGKVVVNNSKHTEAISIDLLSLISNSNKPRNMGFWIGKLSGIMKPYRLELIESLIKKRILKFDTYKLFWLIPLKIYPLVDHRTKQHLCEQVAKSILHGTPDDPEARFLGSLVMANHWERIVFSDKGKRRIAAKQRKLITERYAVAASLLQLIQNQHSAAVVTTV